MPRDGTTAPRGLAMAGAALGMGFSVGGFLGLRLFGLLRWLRLRPQLGQALVSRGIDGLTGRKLAQKFLEDRDLLSHGYLLMVVLGMDFVGTAQLACCRRSGSIPIRTPRQAP